MMQSSNQIRYPAIPYCYTVLHCVNTPLIVLALWTGQCNKHVAWSQLTMEIILKICEIFFHFHPARKTFIFVDCPLPTPPPASTVIVQAYPAGSHQAARQPGSGLGNYLFVLRFVSFRAQSLFAKFEIILCFSLAGTHRYVQYTYINHMHMCVLFVCVINIKAFHTPFLIFKLLLRFGFEQRLNVCNTFTSIDSQLEPSRTGRANESLWPNKCPIRFAVCVQWINVKNLA